MAEMKKKPMPPAGRPPMGPGGHGPRGMGGPGGKPKNAKETIKRIFGYIKNDVPMLILVMFCVIATTVCNLAGSYLLRPIINNLGDNAAEYLKASSSVLKEETRPCAKFCLLPRTAAQSGVSHNLLPCRARQ